jgi:hypothetical protein
MYIDSTEKNWQKSLVRINFHWPWATGPLLKSMTENFWVGGNQSSQRKTQTIHKSLIKLYNVRFDEYNLNKIRCLLYL